MKPKRILGALLRPHIALLLSMLPLSAFLLASAMATPDKASPLCLAAYVISAYTLTIWCIRVPSMVEYFGRLKKENKHAVRWFSDARLRVNVSLMLSLIPNAFYAALQLGLGIYHRSAWYCSLAVYYTLLAAMRLLLARHSGRHAPRERMREELIRYRNCGIAFLPMNIALSVMMFYMVALNRVTKHSEITTIALAAYTFFTLTKAIISAVRYRAYKSPVFSASKAISLASAAVSMLSLEGSMLAAFSGEEMSDATRLAFMGFGGGAVFVFIMVMAIRMIVKGTKELKNER